MAKQLKQLLQEKQEPFILELYLLERGYFRHKFKSSQKGFPKCSKLVKAVYKHLISINQRLKIKNSSPRNHVADNNNQETPELDWYSSDTPETEHITIRVTQVVTDRKLRRQCIEESRQLTPVSVSEQVASNKGFPAGHDGRANLSSIKQQPKKVSEDSILSASLCKILFQSAREKSTIQELVHSNLSLQSLKSKKVAQQTRRLLFDCVREIVETQEKRKKQKHQTQYLATDGQFGKLIEEKIKCWGKQYGQESKLDNLLQFDTRDSTHEWIGYNQHGRKIGREISDAILDEIVNETAIKIAGFRSPITVC